MSRYLDPKNDVAFKKLFGTEDHKPLLVSFLNAILGLEGHRRIKQIDFLPKDQVPLISEAKQTILDIKCTDERNFQYIIEMQNKCVPQFVKRAQFYTAHCYVSQALSGSYYLDLKPVILLAIANYPLFPNKKAVVSYHKTIDIQTQEHDLEDMSYIFVDLSKFKKKEKELHSIQDKWIYFLKNWQHTQQMPKSIQEKELIEAYNVIERFNWSTLEMDAYVRANIALTDEFDARRKEREEGKEEGKEEGILSIAQKLLDKRYPIKEIVELTGLSLETIYTLKKKKEPIPPIKKQSPPKKKKQLKRE